MKKRLIFILSICLFYACNKDEPNVQYSSNNFQYKGVKHEIKTCYIGEYNFDNNERAISIGLSDKVIDFSVTDTGVVITNLDEMEGVNFINFMDDAFSFKKLESGTFSIPDRFWYSSINFDLNISTEKYLLEEDIVSGIITININLNNYEFDFKCLTASGDSITGYYNGEAFTFETYE